MNSRDTLILGRREVGALLDIAGCIKAVEKAFALHGNGKSLTPGVLGIRAGDGGFHIKAAGLELERRLFVTKVNGNFPENPAAGLPAIQGVIILCDAENGFPLAVMDSIEITIMRTGAATAVAAARLARPDTAVAVICGCGNQGRAQLSALRTLLPLRQVFAFDADGQAARRFAAETAVGIRVETVSREALPGAVRASGVVVTCTPSREPFLERSWVAPGTFIAAVGADSEEKQELDPEILSHARVVVDLIGQCARIGELHHAIDRGLMRREDVAAELSEIVNGIKPGRTSADEIIVFDSTGTALQDVATAALAYEKAIVARKGTWLDLTGVHDG